MMRLDLTRSVPASRDRVWRAWTDAGELTRWFWPPSFQAEASVDLRVGGKWHIRSTPAGMGVSGVFENVEPLERLVYTWRWDGEDEETLVTVTFGDAEPGSTELQVAHERFPDAKAADDHEQGWNDCLDRLPVVL